MGNFYSLIYLYIRCLNPTGLSTSSSGGYTESFRALSSKWLDSGSPSSVTTTGAESPWLVLVETSKRTPLSSASSMQSLMRDHGEHESCSLPYPQALEQLRSSC